MKKLIRHFKRWNHWRKRNTNSKLHQFLVLIGLHNSPTMNHVILKEEWEELVTFSTDVTSFRMYTDEEEKK